MIYPFRCPPRAWWPRLFLSALLAAGSLVPGAAQVVPNPGFEADTFTVFPGYISGNAPITGWTASNEAGAGLNPSGGSPFANNGVIPEGSQVAFIQSGGGESSLETIVTGLTPGQKYQLGFRLNARSGPGAALSVAVDDTIFIASPVEPVGGVAPYRYAGLYFDAAGPQATVRLTNNTGGDTTVLIDDVKVTPTAEEWTFTPWIDDATTGLDPSYVYTHTYNFGSAAGVSVNEVAFTGVAGGNPSVPGRLTTTGLNGVFVNDTNTLEEQSRTLANDFIYNGFPSTMTLSGLVPGRAYVASLFSVGWEAAGRVITFRRGDRQLTVDQDLYGDNNGIRFDHRYVADANGEATFFTHPLGAGSFHIYALANREAEVATTLAFSTQPANASGVIGENVQLRASATGQQPVSYQWFQNGTPIAGATTSTLTWDIVSGASSGFFSVRASNAGGSITSSSAFVSVYDKLPAGRVFNTGVDASGVVLPDNDIDSHYQLIVNPDFEGVPDAIVQDTSAFPISTGTWLGASETSAWIGPRFNTSASAGPESDAGAGPGTYVYRTTLDLTGIPPAFSLRGLYAVDNLGSAVVINGVTVPGVPQSPGFGAYTPFLIPSDSLPTGTVTTGLNTLDFVVVNVQAAGYTGLRVDGLELLTVPAGLSPSLISQPQGADVVTGNPVTLSVQAYGSGVLSYQWARNNTPIAGQTGPSLTIPSFNTTVAGSYTVTVTNSVGSVVSAPAVLNALNVPPSIVTQPQSQLAGVGDTVLFSVVADGSPPFSYQWRRNGEALAGQTSATLTLSAVTTASFGEYTVAVGNAYAVEPVVSAAATLTVLPVVPGLFATGVDATGAGVPDGDPDPHYILLVNPDGENEVPATVHNSSVFPIVAGPWIANTDTSKWIAPQFDTSGSAGEAVDAGAGPGTYVYRTTVDLTGFDPASAVLTGGWATDNRGAAVRVNDVDTGVVNTAQFVELSRFSVAAPAAAFKSGLNTLDFVVVNEGQGVGYTGLYVRDLRVLASPAGAAPVIPVVSITLNASGQPVLSFTGKAGVTYPVQRSASLASNSWQAIGSATAEASGAVSFTDLQPPARVSYYRVVIPPQ